MEIFKDVPSCQLIVEIPDSKRSDEASTTLSSFVDLKQAASQNSNGGPIMEDDIPFMIVTRALHLKCIDGVNSSRLCMDGPHEKDECKDRTSNDENVDDDILAFPAQDHSDACPFIGIVVPDEISNSVLECMDTTGLKVSGESLHDDSVLPQMKATLREKVRKIVMPMIHPSLVQLEPLIWIRHLGDPSEMNDDSGCSSWMRGGGGGGVKDILVLSMMSTEMMTLDDTKKNNESNQESSRMNAMEQYMALQSIVDEIHGEAMTAAPFRVIQVCILRQLRFISKCNNENNNAQHDMPMCPVCRFRIIPERLGLPPLKIHQRCSHHDRDDVSCPNMRYLGPWESLHCQACQALQRRLESSGAKPFLPPWSSSLPFMERSRSGGGSWESHNESNVGRIQCYKCGMEETLWVCLTCGLVGCGRYSSGHAEMHYVEKHHPFSLELATQRIWDYETGSFVHRDDLLNCPFMQQILGAVNRAAYHGAAICVANDDCCHPGQEGGLEFGPTAKKTVMVGEQYEALLQSALEDQAQHYHGEISRLKAELAAESVNVDQLTLVEMRQIEELERMIADARCRVEQMSRYLAEAQSEEADHRAKANILLREQAIAKKLLDQLREDFDMEQKQGEQQIEELKQQIADISANIRLQERISKNGNLKEAHILGTSGNPNQDKGKKRASLRRSRR